MLYLNCNRVHICLLSELFQPHGRASETCSSSEETTNQNVKIASAVDVLRCLYKEEVASPSKRKQATVSRLPFWGSGNRRGINRSTSRHSAFGTANYVRPAGNCPDQALELLLAIWYTHL